MRARPHLVLDGLRHVAAAVGADRAFAYVSDAASADRLRDALAERPLSVPVAVVEVAPAYVAGEETAVVRYLNGGPSLPVAKPPRPFERGIGGAPTSVSNVETLAHVALLAAGTDATDHLLLTIAGKDVAPTLVEVVRGVPLRRVLAACGWWHATGALMGGAFGGFVDDKGLAVPLDPDSLAAAGTALGCAAIHLITPFDCPVDVAAGALAFLARESSRQCGVCVSGTRALADTVGRLRDGHATGEDITNLHRWAGGLPGRGACGLLDAAARVTGSLLAVHSAAVATHCAAAASGRPCPACAATPVPDAVRLTVAPPAAASPTLAGRPA
jgi:NADH:ubiquinone oxidoreductase subunit F (NADH-binding)